MAHGAGEHAMDHGVATAGPGTKPGTDHLLAHHGDHPTERQYVIIAIFLTVVTVVEVVIYYIDFIRPILVPSLIILSLGKFVTVVGYYMHLKQDDRRFTWMFVSGLVVTLAVFAALGVLTAVQGFETYFDFN